VIWPKHEGPRNVEAGIGSVIRDAPSAIEYRSLLPFEIGSTQRRIGSVTQQQERRALGYPHEIEETDALFLERLLEAVNFLRLEARCFIHHDTRGLVKMVHPIRS
jgi:hypothetical protein